MSQRSRRPTATGASSRNIPAVVFEATDQAIAGALQESVLIETADVIFEQNEPRTPAHEIEPAEHFELVTFDVDRQKIELRWRPGFDQNVVERSDRHFDDPLGFAPRAPSDRDRATTRRRRREGASAGRRSPAMSRRRQSPWPSGRGAVLRQGRAAARSERRSSRAARGARSAIPAAAGWPRPRRRSRIARLRKTPARAPARVPRARSCVQPFSARSTGH